MKTYLKRILVIGYLLLGVYLNGVSQSDSASTQFDYGRVEGNIYKNDFFNVTITFDSAWVVQNKALMKQLRKAGRAQIAGDDQRLKRMLKAAEVNTANLFSIFKHEVGAPIKFNPSFIVMAENIKNFPGIKSGKDYLFHVKNLLKRSQLKYAFDKEAHLRKIGSKDFWVLEASAEYLGMTITQEYFTRLYKGFTFSIIISYVSQEDKLALYEMLNEMKI